MSTTSPDRPQRPLTIAWPICLVDRFQNLPQFAARSFANFGLLRRPRRRNLTDRKVAGLPRKRKRYTVTDPEQRGLYLRVPPEGPITFAVAIRDHYGRKPWIKVGSTNDMDIEIARERARVVIRRIKDGLPAFEPS